MFPMLVLYVFAILAVLSFITSTTHDDDASYSFVCHAFVPIVGKADHRRSRLLLSSSSPSSLARTVSDTITIDPTTNKTAGTTGTFRQTIEFPSYLELMNVQPGEFVLSEPFVVPAASSSEDRATTASSSSSSSPMFRVKLYPRGTVGRNNNNKGSTSTTNKKSGFGMAYKVLPPMNNMMYNKNNEKVGMYLQYIPPEEKTSGRAQQEFVDATFALRLKGRQRDYDSDSSGVSGGRRRRFDVEWRAGMRFVPLEDSNLAQGLANDFGANLMQTVLLKDFLGIDDRSIDDPTPLTAEVEVTLHDVKEETAAETQRNPQLQSSSSSETALFSSSITPRSGRTSFFGSIGRDIRYIDESNLNIHDSEKVRVGKTIVPILSKLSERQRMFEVGAYPGVEFRILRILDENGQERFTSRPNATYELKPIYPLVSQLERPWPVSVNEQEIPRIYTPLMYNIVSAVGSLATAATGLFAAFILSQAISFFFIPSKSMDPTLQVGDVLLVDKVSPRLFRQRQKVDDIILFSPPSKLQEIVARNGGRLSSRDLFVKRIAASTGDTVRIEADGQVFMNGQNVVKGKRDLCEEEPLKLIEKYIEPRLEETIGQKEVFVMGDCSSVSIDSRVWGPLQTEQIVGKPIVRIWPLERFGWLK